MTAMVHEKVWVDKKLYDDAERQYHETLIKTNLIKTKIHTMVDSAKATIETESEIASATTEKELPNCNTKKQKQKSPPLVSAVNQNTQQTPKKSKKNKKDKKGKLIAEKTGNTQEILTPDKIHDGQEKSETVSEITFKETKNITNEEKKNETIKAVEKFKNQDEVVKCVGQKAGITSPSGQCSLASEVAKARQHIKNSLECMDSVAALAGVPNVELTNKINNLEKDNSDLKKVVEDLRKLVIGLQTRVQSLENKSSLPAAPTKAASAPAPKEDSDDGVDLFGSDDEEESAEAARIREERLAAYNAKKSKKPVLIAKSNIILDVKPWDDETDMKQLESAVRAVQADGLLWGAAKLVPLAYGIHKLQISCVVEDDKISVDWLTEELEKIEDFVQSVDIAAFNKV